MNCLQYLVSRSKYSSKFKLVSRLLNFSNQERTTVFGVSRWHVVVFSSNLFFGLEFCFIFFFFNILTFSLFCLIILVSHVSSCLAFIPFFFSQNWPHSQSTTQSAFIIWLWQTCFISKSKFQSYHCKRKGLIIGKIWTKCSVLPSAWKRPSRLSCAFKRESPHTLVTSMFQNRRIAGGKPVPVCYIG